MNWSAFLLGLVDGLQARVRRDPSYIGRTWPALESNEAYDRGVNIFHPGPPW